jgi:HEAT repeat protein
MTDTNYPEPIRRLIDLGIPENNWFDYPAKFGLTNEHIPDLIRLVEDKDLRFSELTEDEEKILAENDIYDVRRWYAQIHAWRALAQLNAEEAIPNLIGLLYQADEHDDDWIADDLGRALIKIGPACMPALATYLQNSDNGDFARNITIEVITGIIKQYPETREKGIAALLSVLKNHRQNNEGLNAFLIYALAEFKATEHIDLIQDVFETGNVDIFVMGDFEDVQIEMGLLKKRTKPRNAALITKNDVKKAGDEFNMKIRELEKKEKNKRKQEKKSRKKNKKKK